LSSILDVTADGTAALSVGQDGFLKYHNIAKKSVELSRSMKNSWVVACAIKEDKQYVAAGGLDNIVTIYSLKSKLGLVQTLPHHSAYISSIQFVGQSDLLSTSGDNSCCLCDIETTSVIMKYESGVDLQR
jgi:guanine nucleotide-binding protein G(I)/G(S)/G(T) subunit beta-1